MNLQSIKGLTWVTSLAISGLLGYEVYGFFRDKPVLEQFIEPDVFRSALDGVAQPAPPKDDVVDYKFVKNVFIDMNWTGKPKPKPVERPTNPEPKGPPKTPVASLLKVMTLAVHESDPDQSLAYVLYTNPQLKSQATEEKDRILRVGTKLFRPYQHVKVDAITMEGVTFVFEGEDGREPEVVPVSELEKDFPSIAVVDEAVLPARERSISVNSNPTSYNPRRTVEIRKNEFQVGIDTLQELNDNYSQILSQDLRYRTYRDSRTGEVKGIQITDVRSGSLPAQHGVSAGEVLISINGHSVKSVNDAVAYVKANANTTDVWTAVFLKQGREITRTYRSPQN